MIVRVCSIKQLNCEPIDKMETAVICCSSYGERKRYLRGFRKTLFLRFEDILDNSSSRSFNASMAKQIVEFVKNIDDRYILYCCCDGGRSRSSAIAAAILRAFNSDAELEIWNSPIYHPNMLVYSLLTREFAKKTTKIGLLFRRWLNNWALKRAIMRSRR